MPTARTSLLTRFQRCCAVNGGHCIVQGIRMPFLLWTPVLSRPQRGMFNHFTSTCYIPAMVPICHSLAYQQLLQLSHSSRSRPGWLRGCSQEGLQYPPCRICKSGRKLTIGMLAHAPTLDTRASNGLALTLLHNLPVHLLKFALFLC